MNWLYTRTLAGFRGILAGNFDAAHRVANVEKAAGLSALSVDRERLADGGLHAEAIEHRAEHVVVIEAIDQRFVQLNFIGHGAIHHALIEVGRANAPDFAAEHDVVAVMHFGKMVEGAGLLGVGKHILAAVVLDGDVALFDVDVGSPVFAHGAQLDEVAIGAQFANGEEHVHGAHHVIHLGEDRVFAVDHRIRRGTLLGEMDDGVRLKCFYGGFEKIVIGNVADKELDGFSCAFLPDAQPVGERTNRSESLRAELVIPLAPDKIINYRYLMTLVR